TTQIIDSTITLADLNTADIDTRYVTTGTAQSLTGTKTFAAAPSFTAATPFSVTNNALVANLNADLLDGQEGSFYQNAGNLNAGTLPNARLDGSSVTLQGNTFNGASQLVRLDGTTRLPAVDGSLLTNVAATSIAANTVGTTQIINSTIALVDLNTADIDTRYVTTGTAQSINATKTFASAPNFTAATPFSVTNNALVANLNADLLDGQEGSFYQNAGNLSAGTLPDGRLSGTYSGALTLSNTANALTANSVTVPGGSLTVGGSTLVVTGGQLGLGTPTPGTLLDVAGAVTVRNQTPPTVAPAGQGRFYFDTATNQFKISENGGAYTNLVGGTPGADTVGTTQIINSTIALVDLNTTDIDTRYVTTGTAQGINATKTFSAAPSFTAATPFSVTNNALVANLNADLLDGQEGSFYQNAGNLNAGTLPNARLDSSSATLQGNTFNAADRLVKLDGTTRLPAVDGSLLTNLNAGSLASGTVPNARLDSSSVTLQGNSFNAASQLVRLDGTTRLPAVDGSLLTNLNAGSLASGTVPNARLDVSSVTLQGNTFNAADRLVKLDGTTRLPAVDGSLLTGVLGTDNTKVAKAGDVMTGSLTLSGSTLTVTGNAFSVGGSTLVVASGRVGVGIDSPGQSLHVAGAAQIGAATQNGVTLASVAPGSTPSLTATGADANISLDIDAKGTGVVRFLDEPRLNTNLGTQQFAVACFTQNGGGLGNSVIPDQCYAWITFPVPYAAVPTTVTPTPGAASGGASALTVTNVKRTGFLAQWNCDNTGGQCGFLSASYTVTQ
ncbi:MAG: beta strand repeat-containing protein, partial [Elusimicrobiota bacterium]